MVVALVAAALVAMALVVVALVAVALLGLKLKLERHLQSLALQRRRSRLQTRPRQKHPGSVEAAGNEQEAGSV